MYFNIYFNVLLRIFDNGGKWYVKAKNYIKKPINSLINLINFNIKKYNSFSGILKNTLNILIYIYLSFLIAYL